MSQSRSPESPAAVARAAPAVPPASASREPPSALDLAALRAELDALDDALHDLLMRRFALVGRLAESRAKGDGPALRPGREAQILRRLLARHAGPMPAAALVRLWREILAASTALQGPFSVAVFAPSAGSGHARLAREHFGAATPIRPLPTPAQALAAVAAGEASVAVLPAPEEEDTPEAAWWTKLDSPRTQVVARLPFYRPRFVAGDPEALVVSVLPADPTGRDRTLIRLEAEAGQSRARLAAALAAAGFAPLSLMLQREGAATLALAEVEGYLAGDAGALARLAALPFARAQLLGAYAVPETGE
ncbi:chorismate mutase [Caldovatus aquaticus]|uniref:chorismate mutase n=1 Tax=Caldovatus aquaticus TaxID=2865671 RepID=A0ABS7F1E3_9PROT|nr:chorismate mutase [Caldovatus aquaticus]MBW8269384.1 chorismate mutase [Caldovatus aquaticus]